MYVITKECWNSKADPDHQQEPKMKIDKRNETWQDSRSSSKQTKELWLSIINTIENNWYMNESYLRAGTNIGQEHEDGIPSLQSNKGENIHLPKTSSTETTLLAELEDPMHAD